MKCKYYVQGELLPMCSCKGEPFSQWKDVREELPPDSRQVLVCNMKYNKPFGFGYYNHGSDWGYNDAGWVTKGMSGPVVTHWQPLPAPPKEG